MLSSLNTLENADRENGNSSRSKLLHTNCRTSDTVSSGLNTPVSMITLCNRYEHQYGLLIQCIS